MSPFERAALVYDTEVCARSFEEDLILHATHAYIYVTPCLFIMFRPVEKNADISLIRKPDHKFARPDCWWVYVAAGKLSEFFAYLPYYLPWVGWERQNAPRFYSTQKVREKVNGKVQLAQSDSSGETDCALISVGCADGL